MNKLVFLFSILITTNIFALEVDEKLTLRVLKVSSSGKTILINRGIEDGLVQGDHAKFFLSIGVVARGVVIKTSPTRSVWSLYRLVNAEPVMADSVMRLKITPAVKITEDESKMIAMDDIPNTTVGVDPRTLGIPLEEGADDLKQEDRDLMTLQRGLEPSYGDLKEKPYEVWASVGFEMANSSARPDIQGQSDQTGNSTSSNITLGGEYYFNQNSGFLAKVSLAPFLRLISNNIFSMDSNKGSQAQDKTTQFGLGVNYYPFAAHYHIGKFIPYLNFSFAFSSSLVSIDNGTTIEESSGTGNALSFGGGYKLYTKDGYGMRAVLEYFSEAENLTDDFKTKWTRNTSGPRLYAAISKRF